MKCKIILTIMLSLWLITTSSATTFQGDLARTGNFTSDLIIPKVEWKTYLTGLVGASPVVSEDKVFITNWYGWTEWGPGLYVLNAITGEILMRFDEIKGASTPFIHRDKVILGGMKECGFAYCGYLYIVNLTSKEVKELLLDGTPSWYGIASSPIVLKDYIYVLTHTNSTLWKISIDGRIVSKLEGGGEINPYTSPAVFNDKIIFAMNLSGENRIYCVDENLNELWNITVDSKVKNTPTVAGNILIFATENYLYFYEITSNRPKKMIRFNSTISSAAVFKNLAFIGSKDGLHAFNLTNFEQEWFYKAGRVDSSPAVANGVVYFATNVKNGAIYALDIEGNLLWSYTLKPPEGLYWNIMSSPFIHNGKLYIGSDSGYVYCFGSSGTIEFNVTLGPGKVTIDSKEIRKTSALYALIKASHSEFEDYTIDFSVKYYDGLEIMGLRGWVVRNETSNIVPEQYLLEDGETVYYCLNSISLKINAKIRKIEIDSFEVFEGKIAGNMTIWINVSLAKEGFYVLVVSGVNEKGDYIAGISTFYAKDFIRVPVLIHIHQRNEPGKYRLFTAIYEFEKYPETFECICKMTEVEVRR